MHSLDEFARKKKALLCLILVFCIGASNPFMEISRQCALTWEYFFNLESTHNEMIRFNYQTPQSLDNEPETSNFFSMDYKNSAFYHYFCKK